MLDDKGKSFLHVNDVVAKDEKERFVRVEGHIVHLFQLAVVLNGVRKNNSSSNHHVQQDDIIGTRGRHGYSSMTTKRFSFFVGSGDPE